MRDKLRLEEIKPPASARAISTFVQRARTTLPADYAKLLGETDGFKTQGWEFCGTHAWRIPDPDANYLIVAQGLEEDFAICFREEQTQSEVFTYDLQTNEATPRGTEFIRVFISVVSEGETKPQR